MEWSSLIIALPAAFVLGVVCERVRARLPHWHRRLYQCFWRWRSRRRGGRPRLDPELIALIRRMSWENPLWGAPRIHGELLLLGFKLAQSTVSQYMLRRRGGPNAGWTTFLRENAGAIASVDMLTVPSLFLHPALRFRRLGS